MTVRDTHGTLKSPTATENTEFKEEARDTCGTLAEHLPNTSQTLKLSTTTESTEFKEQEPNTYQTPTEQK